MAKRIVLHDKTFELSYTSTQIGGAISKIADQINIDYQGKQVLVIGVLDGAFMALADLLKKLTVGVSLEFVKIKSYSGFESTGVTNQLIGLTSNLENAEVIIVEDIIESGTTLQHLLAIINEQNPKSVKIATLLLKADTFKDRFPIHYIGFSIPNKFVVGYGMDYDGQGRQLKEIYTVVE